MSKRSDCGLKRSDCGLKRSDCGLKRSDWRAYGVKGGLAPLTVNLRNQ